MKNLKKGFTLVELIVVITILAILGTIAFISLQGYSSDARNSKRTSDINSIGSQMNIKSTEGVNLLSMVEAVTDNTLADTNFIGGINATGATYKAGNAVGTALGIKETEFRDPNGDRYVIGVTTKKEGKYEIAAAVEVGGGTEAADVVGTYIPRSSNPDIVATYATGATTVTGISSTQIGLLVYGDVVDLDGSGALTATGTITAVSGDQTSVTLSVPLPTNLGIRLNTGSLLTVEPAGLIDAVGATTGEVTDGGSVLPY